MARTSILDAFNAAARFSSQALDVYSREQKYHLDTQLYQQAQDFEMLQNRLAQDLTKPDASGNLPFLNKPEEYRNYVNKALAEWKQNAVKAGNGSRYYNDSLNRLALQGQTELRKKIYAAELQAQREQMTADYQKNIQSQLNQPYSEAAVSRALGFVEGGARNNIFGPAAAEKEKAAVVDAFNLKAGAYQDNGTDTTEQAENAVLARLEANDRLLRDRFGIEPDAYIENRARKTAEMRQGAVLAVQDRNYTNLGVEHRKFQQMLNDYLEHAPNAPSYTQVVEAWRRGRAEADAAADPESNRWSEYAGNKKPEISGWFRWDERLGAEPGRDLSQADINRYIDHLVQLNLDQYYGDARDEEGGRLTLTIPEAYMALGDFLERNGMTVPEREFKQWFDDAFIRRIEKEPGLNQAAGFASMLLTNPLAVNTPEAEKATGYAYNDSEKASQIAAVDQLNADYHNRAFNLIANIGLLPGNQGLLKESIAELKNAYIGELSVILDSNLRLGSVSTVEDTGNYKDMAKALEWIEKSPVSQIEDRKGGSPYGMTNDDSIMAYKQVAASFMADKLNEKGISLVDIDRDGRVVTGYDGEGNAYRIRGMEKEMPKTGGGEIERTVLVIERKAGDEWEELEELTEEQLGAGESFAEALRRFNQPAARNPANDAFRRQQEQRRQEMRDRGINFPVR